VKQDVDWDAKNKELLTRYQQGDKDALGEFLECNRGLVHHLLRRYQRLPLGMEEADLEQLGFLGLIEAARRPQVLEKTCLSNYLSFCIRKRLYLGIWQEGYLVHLPRRQHEAAVQARRVEGERLVRGKPEDWGWRHLGVSAGVYRERLRCYQMFLGNHVSLDAAKPGEERLLDVLQAGEDSSPETQTLRRWRRKTLQETLCRLPKQQFWVVRGYFGLGYRQRRSLRELGKCCGLSEEQVRQLIQEALERLRQTLGSC
jgi:RNA polymerase primary sigma factor